MRFDQRLVLNQYMLSLFGAESFEELAKDLKEPEYEGLDESRISRLYGVLSSRFPGFPAEDLLRYDQNIVRHTRSINDGRKEPVVWRYFQYLSLLFTEIYLERYFSDSEALRGELNDKVREFNADKADVDQVCEYEPEDLRKLAFWSATGSGKTLLMHVNLLQYLDYARRYGQKKPDRVLLLTPNEGLSSQHLDEFADSGIDAARFSKNGGSLIARSMVEVLEVYRLVEQEGATTVEVDALEGDNLVLVDEGHRGATGEKWRGARQKLCESRDSFAFEYSATFGQMASGASKDLVQEYAKCTLFDYSYKYFHGDGYGKDFHILNLEQERSEDVQRRYMTAALLSFHQQQLVYEDNHRAFQPYGIERPLWMFVGSSVTKSSKKERSDAVEILRFLGQFTRERERSVADLRTLLSGDTGLSYKGTDLFADKFTYLSHRGGDAESLYASILEGFFNADRGGTEAQGAPYLRVEELKEAPGELALRLGEHDAFGVVNVGDARGLARALEEEQEVVVSEKGVGESLFDELKSGESKTNLLVGARKFGEGWSSWRVSSVGLMNVGQSEGAQIIQLFGRGVRLKGLDFSLKRSAALDGVHPEYIEILETLNVFGLHADYMEEFQKLLAKEGLPSGTPQTVVLPTIRTTLPASLKVVRLAEGGDFKKDGPLVELPAKAPHNFGERRKIDWYPKVRALAGDRGAGSISAGREQHSLRDKHLDFIDLDAVHFELVRFKREKGWHNLSISRRAIKELLEDPGWYELSIPGEDLEFPAEDPLRRVSVWQEIAVALLKKFCERCYTLFRQEYENEYLEYQEMDENDTNFVDEYTFKVEDSDGGRELGKRLLELKSSIESGDLRGECWGPLDAFVFDQHLYNPLVHLKNKATIEVVPTHLNEGEREFVRDLRRLCENNPESLGSKQIYLLRNKSTKEGIGFFEADNFRPDFILWLVDGRQQYVTFVDPKGVRNLAGALDPKIEFHKTIKDIEKRLGDPRVTLESFIVSNTDYAGVSGWGLSKSELEDRNVLFQKEDKETYINKMLDRIIGN